MEASKVFCIFVGGLEFVGHSFAYVAHFVYLRDIWIRTQRAGKLEGRGDENAPPPSPKRKLHKNSVNPQLASRTANWVRHDQELLRYRGPGDRHK
jgi:hypothetical protein